MKTSYKQQIIDLLTSNDPSNRKLGLELEKSQDIDLSEFWEEMKYLHELVRAYKGYDGNEKYYLLELFDLDEASLYDLQLEKVPSAIKYMKNLCRLDMEKNEISEIPGYIFEMPNLQHLDIRTNNIKTLPNFDKNKCKLKDLLLDQNSLDHIPNQVFDIKSLESLSLDNNNIKTIPKEIEKLTNLRYVWLYKNPRNEDLVENGLINLINNIYHQSNEPYRSLALNFPISKNAKQLIKRKIEEGITIADQTYLLIYDTLKFYFND